MATYSFLDVVASIIGPGGAITLGNGAGSADEGISVEFADEVNQMTIGADGSVMHSLHASKASVVTVRLLKTSPINKQLMLLYNFQRVSSLAHGRNVINIRDVIRGDTYTCRLAAFKKVPANQYSKDGNTLEWTFDCGITDVVLGLGF